MVPLPPQLARVLVVDDDAVMREVLEALLVAAGFTVETAESGEAALQRLRSEPATEVVLADVQLPGISGKALAGELRVLTPASRLIGMSGSEPGAEVRAAFDAFLLKPFSPEDFASAAALGSDEALSGATARAATQSSGWVSLDEATFRRLAAALSPTHLQQLYELTLQDASERLRRMADALAAADPATYRREAHALKGGCGMVGAAELAALAAAAEAAGAGSFGDTAAPEEFSAVMERLRRTLTAHFMHNG